jgi:hypothetical protein
MSDSELSGWQDRLRWATDAGNQLEKSRILVEIGKIHFSRGNFDAARQILLNALQIAQNLDELDLQLLIKDLLRDLADGKTFQEAVKQSAQNFVGQPLTAGESPLVKEAFRLHPDRFQDPTFLALVKEHYEQNPSVQFPLADLAVILHVLPDNRDLTADLSVIFEIKGVKLFPHFFTGRLPPYHLPNTLIFPMSAKIAPDLAKPLTRAIKNNLPGDDFRTGFTLLEKLLLLLIHVATRMDAGIRPTLDPFLVVKEGDRSPFYSKCYPNDSIIKKLSPKYYHVSFDSAHPNIASDRTRNLDNEVGLKDQPGTFGAFFQVYFQTLRNSGEFPGQMPLKLIFRWLQELGILFLGTAPPKSGFHFYECINDLILYNILVPGQPSPHLAKKGIIIRDLLLGIENSAIMKIVELPLQRICPEEMVLDQSGTFSLGALEKSSL